MLILSNWKISFPSTISLANGCTIYSHIHTYINTYSQSARVPVVITVAQSSRARAYIQPVSQRLEPEPEHTYINTYINTFFVASGFMLNPCNSGVFSLNTGPQKPCEGTVPQHKKNQYKHKKKIQKHLKTSLTFATIQKLSETI